MPKTVVEKTDEKRLVTVSFPKGLLLEVDKIVNRKESKYLNRADFCRSAVRELLNKEKGIFPIRERTKGD